MAWDPTSKITDFGNSYETMLIPETTDPVLGEDDPGGTPVAISAMASFSGQGFGKITNNIEFLKKRILTENLTIDIGNLTELAAAQVTIDEIGFIDQGVSLTIQFDSGATLSSDSTDWPLTVDNIAGAGHIVFTCSTSCTLTSTDGTAIIHCSDVTPGISTSNDIELINSSTSAAWLTWFEGCSSVSCAFDYGNSGATGAKTAIYASYCSTFNPSLATFGTGYDVLLNVNDSYVRGSVALDAITTDTPFKITRSRVLLSSLDNSHMPTGSTATSMTTMVEVDELSDYRVESYGIGGTVTFTDTGDEYVTSDVNRFLSFMPKRIDTDVTLILPTGEFDDTNDAIVIDGFWSPGSAYSITVRGYTITTNTHTNQATVLDPTGAGVDALTITNCQLPLEINSITCNSGDRDGMLIQNSSTVTVKYCYFIADDEGIAVEAGSNVVIEESVFGAINDNGIMCRRSIVYAHENEVEAATQPTDYGYNALEGGIIGYKFSLSDPLTGNEGTSNDDSGGVVRA